MSEKVIDVVEAINLWPMKAYKGCKTQATASLGARGAALGKIACGAAAPVIVTVPCVTVGILGGPFGIAFGAIAGVIIGSVVAVPTVIWGVGDLLIPEVLYKRKE
jgi:hypothetical protein